MFYKFLPQKNSPRRELPTKIKSYLVIDLKNEFRFRFPALLALVVLAGLPSDGIGVVLCPFYLLTDIPCPACGLTRSMSSLLHLEISKSLQFHPLGSLVLFFLLNCAFTNQPYFRFTNYQLGKIYVGRFFSFNYIISIFITVWLIRIILLVPFL